MSIVLFMVFLTSALVIFIAVNVIIGEIVFSLPSNKIPICKRKIEQSQLDIERTEKRLREFITYYEEAQAELRKFNEEAHEARQRRDS